MPPGGIPAQIEELRDLINQLLERIILLEQKTNECKSHKHIFLHCAVAREHCQIKEETLTN